MNLFGGFGDKNNLLFLVLILCLCSGDKFFGCDGCDDGNALLPLILLLCLCN